MLLEAIRETKIRLPDGSMEILRPGEWFEVKAEKGKQLVQMHRAREVEISDGRRKALEKCMDATMFMAMKEIQKGGYWKVTPEVKKIEHEVHETYKAVQLGLKKLSDYRDVVGLWKNEGTKRCSYDNHGHILGTDTKNG